MDDYPIRETIIIIGLVIINALITVITTAIGSINSRGGYPSPAHKGSHISIFRYLVLISSVIYSTAIMDERYLVVVAYLFLVFSILYPEKIGRHYAERCAYLFSRLFRWAIGLFKPFIWLIEKNVNFFLRVTRNKPSEMHESVTEEEIISMVNEGQEQGVIEADEAEMISNIIEFDEKTASDIMTHRMKIAALDSKTTIKEALGYMLEERYSRFPVYDDNIDNIIGIAYLRDVITHFLNPKQRGHKITVILRKPYFVPESQGIDVLFKDMQTKKQHMAVVFDEYGQTAGLVAMEDILEEIVGDIQDEYDEEVSMIIPTGNEDEYIVRGDATLEELGEATGIVFDGDEMAKFDTVNGFIISRLEHIPSDDEDIQIEGYGFGFDIEEVRNKVIRKVRVYKVLEGSTSGDE